MVKLEAGPGRTNTMTQVWILRAFLTVLGYLPAYIVSFVMAVVGYPILYPVSVALAFVIDRTFYHGAYDSATPPQVFARWVVRLFVRGREDLYRGMERALDMLRGHRYQAVSMDDLELN
jgi:hypothetical protein